jgi:arsenate reductase
VFSAGSNPRALSSRAVQVMKEIGLDISAHRSKGLDDIPVAEADMIVTLCAEEVCPVVPGGRAKKLHWPLPDPAGVQGSDEEQLEAFRKVRDEIVRRIPMLWSP